MPERATRSVTSRLFAANACCRVVKLEADDGMSFNASEANDTLPSLLPSTTSHIGIPNYDHLIALNSNLPPYR